MTISRQSDVWREIAAIAEHKIQDCRSALEGDADEISTTRLRAQIRAYRDVLAWPDLGHNEPAEGIELI